MLVALKVRLIWDFINILKATKVWDYVIYCTIHNFVVTRFHKSNRPWLKIPTLIQLTSVLEFWLSNTGQVNMWPSTTKWGSLRGISKKYFITMNTICYTFWCKNDYSAIFLSKVTKCLILAYNIECSKQLYRDMVSQTFNSCVLRWAIQEANIP